MKHLLQDLQIQEPQIQGFQIHALQKLAQLFIISLVFLTFTACSYSPKSLKDSYNNLGKEYTKELKQMSDYTPEQSAKLDIFATDIMQWHRKNRLPAYANLMKNLSTKLESTQGLSDADFHALLKFGYEYPNFHESYESNVQLAKLATTLTDEQFIQISKRINEQTRDYTENLQQTSWEKQKRQGVQSMSNIFSYLKVTLTNKQLDIMRKHMNYLDDKSDVFIASNEQWNNRLVELLSERHEQGFVKKFADHMLNDNITKRLLQIAPADTQHRHQVIVNMYKELFASLTKQQKATLVKQLKSISITMTELMNAA